jgi:hypothetical protein
MPQAMKAFSYNGHRKEAVLERNAQGITREVIAAPNEAEALRLSRLAGADWTTAVHESTDSLESIQAMTAPGTVFWTPMNWSARTNWNAVEVS